MAITYPLTPPTDPTTSQIELTMQNIVGLTSSPFTGQQQVQLWPAEFWMAKCTIAPGRRPDYEVWLAFLAALRGTYGTFYLGDPGGATPRGVATGTPRINGGGQTGTSIITDGWTPNTTGIVKAGDYLQWGSGTTQRLHKNLSDANTDSGGNVTLDIWPRIRESPSDNALITVANTKGVFRLAGNDRTWTLDSAMIYRVSFNAVEAI